MLSHYHVQHVIICSALYRASNIGHQTQLQFQSKVNRFNTYLKNFADVEPNITYHTHRGFWDIPINEWSRDFIHPNTPLGRKKYATSLTRAVHHFIKRYKSSCHT